MTRSRVSILTIALGIMLAGVAVAQRPIAIVNANLVTNEGAEIKMGTILIRNGKIAEIGKRVKVPPGAKIVDAKGGTVMPGLVSAYSRAGLGGGAVRRAPQLPPRFRRRFRGRRFGGGSSGRVSNQAAKKVIAGLYARQEIFGDLLRQGVTTLALSPSGGGFPGRGALVDPNGKTLDELTVNDAAFVSVYPQNNTKAKKLVKDTLDKAKKLVEERKKPKTAPKKPTTKTPTKKPATTSTSKPASKTPPGKTPPKKEPPKKTPPATKPAAKAPTRRPTKRPARKDPNLEVLADLLEGKTRAFLAVNSATDLAHYMDCVGDMRYPCSILALNLSNRAGLLSDRMEDLKKLKASVLMPAQMTTKPMTSHLINPAAQMTKAGIQVGFVIGDSKQQVRGVFANLIELVRAGLPRDAALKGITLVPAKMLGIADKVGSLKKGKDANLLLFTGDPLSPLGELKTVFHKGKEVLPEEEEG